ncbi:MAG: hypothetical protein U9O82_07225 [Thermodesulfobacteriota bacterium]|nr:hypothetical protein [Thermodesulfobacteriota bacterium]
MPIYTNLEDHDDIVSRLREIPGLKNFPPDEFREMLKKMTSVLINAATFSEKSA